MAFTKIAAAGIGSTETVTLDGVSVINNESIGGNLTVTGNATIGGVLTYEDVTNVDSVGLITARNGIVVGSGITLSKDGDIFATGISTVKGIHINGTLEGQDLKVGTGVTITRDGDGFFTGVVTATSYSGIDLGAVTGATGDFSIADKIVHTGDTNTAIRFPDADTITAETGGSERVRIHSSGFVGIGTDVPNSYDAGGRTLVLDQRGTLAGMTIRGSQQGAIYFADGLSGNEAYRGRIEYKHADDALDFGTSGTATKVRIDSSGRVIITNDSVTHSTGTNTQYAPLVVRGNTSATSSRAAFINFARSEASANIAADEGIGEIWFGDQQAGEYAAIKCAADGGAAVGDYPGRLTFHTTADGGTTMSERLRIASDGKIGISTVTPNSKLHILASNESAILIEDGNTGNNAPYLEIIAKRTDGNVHQSFSGQIFLSRNRTEQKISSGLKLGTILFGGNHTNASKSNILYAASIAGMSSDDFDSASDMPTDLVFFTGSTGRSPTTANVSSGEERLRIHASGQVSVGEDTSDSHDYKFVVKPNRSDTSKAALGLLVDGDSGQGGGVASESISAKIVNTNTFNNSTHQYAAYIVGGQQYTAPVTACYVSASGTYNATIGMRVDLTKHINANTDGFSYYSKVVESNSGSGVAYHFRGEDNGNIRINIEKDGDIKNTNNSYGGLSDVKLKENIVDANSQWDDIKALRIRNFNFKDDPDKVKLLGVVAQEAEVVSAGLVDTSNDIETDATTGEGTVTGTTKYVKYSILYMKAVKALQEAQTRIETLETKVAALEG